MPKWGLLSLKNFLQNYVKNISEGLLNIAATNEDGKGFEINDALFFWVEKTKYLRDVDDGFIFFAGNGASATMAEHMAHDCLKTASLKTLTCSETAHITAIGNDLSYENVFSFKINRMLTRKDMLVTISSSGNSQNIIKAIEAAKEKNSFVVTVSGMSPDNKSRSIGNLNFYVPLSKYGMIEAAHAALLHAWLDMFLDMYMGGKN